MRSDDPDSHTATDSDSGHVFRQCLNCESYGPFEFYNPKTVYCEACGKKVGETSEEVTCDVAALVGSDVIHVDSRRVLASVEWDADWIEVYDAE